MKVLALALLALVVVAAVLEAGATDAQDENCRTIARGNGMSEETINKVAQFKLYGPDKDECFKRCRSVKMDIGFDYYGKQACCCGSTERSN